MTTKPTDRDLTIQGLRELADFLDAHPDVPIGSGHPLQYSVDSTLKREGRTSSAERRAEVERVAAILDVEPRDDTHYVASRQFGGVSYLAVSCDPGPKPGLCVVCRTGSVHRAGSELIDGRVCTACLTPDVAAAIDRAAAIDKAHAAANRIEAEAEAAQVQA